MERTSRDAPTGHKLFNFISTTFQSRRWAHIKSWSKKIRVMWFIKKQHSATTMSLMIAAFPQSLRDDVIVALSDAGIAPHEPHMDFGVQITVDGCEVRIPSRVYFPPAQISDIEGLSPQQKAIFASIMTRHHDGHQREYWAKVLCSHPATWTAPYMAAILGDYVIEVLETVRKNLTADWATIMAHYVSENRVCLRALNHRILTCWSIYYRYSGPNIRFLTDYPGYIVAVQLGLWDRRTATKLLRKAMANKTLHPTAGTAPV
jgi:hypothetical protein